MSGAPVFRSRTGLGLLIGIGLLVIIGLIRSVSPPEPQDGPSGSSYATHQAGGAALASLLERNGYHVERMRVPVSEAALNDGDAVVLVNSDLDPADAAALAAFVTDGGRFVAVASDVAGHVDSAPGRSTTTEMPARSLFGTGAFGDIEQVHPQRVWRDTGSMLPLVGSEDGTLVAIEYVDAGVVVAVSDASVVSNGLLDREDNALLALETIGDPVGTIWFVEYVHGFTQPTGLAGLPTRWKQALLILAAATAVWLIARGKRFGPVEEVERSMPPPRSAYVDALALTLESGNDPAAAALLDEAIERELRRRGVQPGSPEALRVASAAIGADREMAEAALGITPSHSTIRAKSDLLSRLINKEQL